MTLPPFFFIFDVESVGLHGEGFAAAGGVYTPEGVALQEFAFHTHPDNARGSADDRKWVKSNVTVAPVSIEMTDARFVRDAFWETWMSAVADFPGVVMAAECGWPVEAHFLAACVDDSPTVRNWKGPYPLHEIASIMLMANMDPMATYTRQENELPAHEPLADARLSARLLETAIRKLS